MEPMMSGPGPIGTTGGWSTPTTGGDYSPQPAQPQGRMGFFRGEGGGRGGFGRMRGMNPNPFGMGGMMGYGMPFGMMGGYGGYGGMGGMGYGMPQMGYGGMGGFGGYGGMGQMDGYGGMGGLGMGFGGMGGYGMNPFAMQGYGRRPQPRFDMRPQPAYPDMRLNGPGSPEDPNRFTEGNLQPINTGGPGLGRLVDNRLIDNYDRSRFEQRMGVHQQPRLEYDRLGRRYGDPYFGTGGPGAMPPEPQPEPYPYRIDLD